MPLREDTPHAPFAPFHALLLAILFVSSSAILIRVTEAAPLSVAGWRLGLATLILLLLPGARAGLKGLETRDLARVALAGLFLAAHFGAWIASLRLLPIAVSVLLVSTHPLFVLGLRTFAGELPRLHEFLGVTLALCGMAVMQLIGRTPEDPVAFSTYTLGVAMALAGAAALAGYLVIGADVRTRLRTTSFLVLVYGIAAIALFGFLLGAGGRPLPPNAREAGIYILLALGPTLGGHGLFAYSVGHLRPVIVSAAFLAEPVMATLLAIPFLDEVPNTRTVLGGLLILAGLALVVLPGASERPSRPASERPSRPASEPAA